MKDTSRVGSRCLIIMLYLKHLFEYIDNADIVTLSEPQRP